MEYCLTLGVFSCLFWTVSVLEPLVYWPTHYGKRYGTVSFEFQVANFAECKNTCVSKQASQPCYAFNYRESDGSCQLVYENSAQLVPADGFKAFAQFLCLTEYPRIENAKESYLNWTGEYPAPKGAMVLFTCPNNFTDNIDVHNARCCASIPDAWCSTFLEEEEAIICPP
ncbi:unnamed protein product [Darwinula stevensoni]|uniref:Apple domain-containing protein n=1 Tax=Darwinula stevensoni TaxID=69355 RepID=A0A7R8XLZ1_9CRUS|nr:unnamed protein product [Darwinula stevensoni]CAG0894902.1 unnamed protein product [Darwinula stevensoni]